LATDGCVTPVGGGFAYDGTFTISTPAGTVSGTVHGGTIGAGSAPHDVSVPVDADLTVTATSSGVVAHVGEVLHVHGTWVSNQLNGGPFDATINDRPNG